jgi:cell division inhibitor SulA
MLSEGGRVPLSLPPACRISRELARRLGLQENGVRRLLDLDHRSHIDQVDRALAALGKRLEVRVLAPA